MDAGDVMDAAVARSVAHYSHIQKRDRHGEPLVEHVARVVAAVPAEAQALAWLHDVLEHSPTTTAELRAHGLTPVELAALELLTRRPGESYAVYILRIAYARGAAGRLARVVKLADLDDHLAREWSPDDPPYSWARRHVAVGSARVDYSSSSPNARARETASERDDASSLR
jgi:hypothetical protein